MRRLSLSLQAALVLLACGGPALAQPAPALDVAPRRLLFRATDRAERVAAQRIDVRNAGEGPLVWEARADAPWVVLAPTRGLAPAALLVGIDLRALRPGRYEAHVVVEAGRAERSPQTVVVQLVVAATQPPGPPALQVAPERLAFSASPGQTQPLSSSLRVTAEQDASVAWTVRTDSPWLSAVPTGGTTPAEITITAAPAPLAIGDHSASVIIAPAGQGEALRVPVTVAIRARGGELAFETTVLPAAVLNQPYSQALPIRGGRPPYTFQVAGSPPPDLLLQDGVLSGMPRAPGTFRFTVIASDSSDPPGAVTQTLTLAVGTPGHAATLVVDCARVSLWAAADGEANRVTIHVSSGGAPLAWTVSGDAPWLQLSAVSGEGAGSFTVTATTSKKAGTYRASITVTMDGAENSPIRIPVELVIRENGGEAG